MNTTQRVVSKSAVRVLRPNKQKKAVVPFSAVGLVAILCTPLVFFVNILSGPQVATGIFYLVMLALLSNQKEILVVLFTALASIFLLIDMRLFYALPGTEMAFMEKMIALPALWLITVGILRAKQKEKQAALKLERSKRKPVVAIRINPEIADRLPAPAETRVVFKHIRRHPAEKLDDYTVDLVRFMYVRSKKN